MEREDVERIVKEVIARLSRRAPSQIVSSAAWTFQGKLLTEGEVRSAAERGVREIALLPGTLVTPLAKDAIKELGISAQIEVDFARLQRWKESIVKRLTEGITQLCRGNGVEIVRGTARFAGPHEASVTGEEGEIKIEFENALIATGSVPIELPGLRFDGELVLDSAAALALEEVPEELVIVGGGYIGLEIGTAYAKLGSQVTVVEMMEQLLPRKQKGSI